MLLFYTIPYLLVFFVITAYHSAKPDDAKGLCIFSGIILACFAGFSYDVGWDYVNYVESMKYNRVERYELLEQLLLTFCMKLKMPQLFFIANHFAITLFVILSIKKAVKDPYMAILSYLCIPFMYLFSFSTIRAELVMAITLFAYEYALKENRWKLFLLLIFFGFFIHNVSLIGLLILPLHYLKLGKYFNIGILIVSYILSFYNVILNIPFLEYFEFLEETNERLESYLESGGNIGGQSVIHFVFLFFIIINLLYYKNLSKISEKAPKYILFVTVGYCLHLLFQYNPTLSSRVSRSFYAFEILLIPSYLMALGRTKSGMRTIRDSFIVIFLILFVYQLCLHNYNGDDSERVSTYLPYRLFFFN